MLLKPAVDDAVEGATSIKKVLVVKRTGQEVAWNDDRDVWWHELLDTQPDTHEAQAAYDLVLAQEFAAVNELDNRRNTLQTIIGAAPGNLAPLKPGVTLAVPQPSSVDPWVSSAENQNYGVAAAYAVLVMAISLAATVVWLRVLRVAPEARE